MSHTLQKKELPTDIPLRNSPLTGALSVGVALAVVGGDGAAAGDPREVVQMGHRRQRELAADLGQQRNLFFNYC